MFVIRFGYYKMCFIIRCDEQLSMTLAAPGVMKAQIKRDVILILVGVGAWGESVSEDVSRLSANHGRACGTMECAGW